jgi:hypothetical protein
MAAHHPLQERGTVHHRHAHVGDDHGHLSMLLELLQSFLAAQGNMHVIVAPQMQHQAFYDARFIIDAQDVGLARFAHDCGSCRALSANSVACAQSNGARKRSR